MTRLSEISDLVFDLTGKRIEIGETDDEWAPKIIEALHLGKAALDALTQPMASEAEYAETDSGILIPRRPHPLYDN